jgi:hypothetical protein
LDDCGHLLRRIAAGEDLFGLAARRWRTASPLVLEGRALRAGVGGGASEPFDVLISHLPARADYADLLYPAAADLRGMGLTVGALVPAASRRELAPLVPSGVRALPVERYGGLGRYLVARRAFARLLPTFRTWSERHDLDATGRRSVAVLLQAYAWERSLFESLLRRHRPRAVLGLHMQLHPGLTGAVRAWRSAGSPLTVLLIQHGVFSHTWGEHDFAGADRVLTWGEHFSDELAAFGSDAPPSLVVGNPKLERLAASFSPSPRPAGGRLRVLYLSTNGVDVDERAAVDFVIRSLPPAEGLDVRYRPHPDEPLQKFHDRIADGALHPDQLLPASGDPYRLLADADVVIGSQTTLLPEAVALGIPAIQVLPERFDLGWTDLGLLGVEVDGDLASVVRALAHERPERRAAIAGAEPLVRRMFGRSEGASRRVAEAVASVVGERRAGGVP